MSKAVLIMDMPKNCAECNLCSSQDGEYFCIPDDFMHYLSANHVNHESDKRPEWCPLKLMPEKVDASKFLTQEFRAFYEGRNACIDDINK